MENILTNPGSGKIFFGLCVKRNFPAFWTRTSPSSNTLHKLMLNGQVLADNAVLGSMICEAHCDTPWFLFILSERLQEVIYAMQGFCGGSAGPVPRHRRGGSDFKW